MAEPPLLVLGVDHHRTPVAVRELLAVAEADLPRRLAELAEMAGCTEAVVLSTCNRAEWYLGGAPDAMRVIAAIAARAGLAPAALETHCYRHAGAACVRHLFRVVSSLESLVLGEYQIVQQVKAAYDAALAAGTTGALLNPLFQRALAVAKAVRANTDIGRHKVSVASVAVDLARQVHGDLAHAGLLVVGAGEIAELAVTHLLAAGVQRLTVVNRTHERALQLAATVRAEALPWERLPEAIVANDIVISSTAAPGLVVDAEQIRTAMRARRRRPLLLVDLAVPRDIDPHAADLADVYVYNVDDLEAVVAANRKLRQDEVIGAEAVVEDHVVAFLRDQAGGKPELMTQIAGYFADVVAAETARLAGKLKVGDAEQLRYGLERVGNKLQHQILRWLREHRDDPAAERTVREMLGIDGPDAT